MGNNSKVPRLSSTSESHLRFLARENQYEQYSRGQFQREIGDGLLLRFAHVSGIELFVCLIL